MSNPDCPHCGGVPPSTDGKTECGWCSEDHVPSVVPEFNFAPLFDLIWDDAANHRVVDESDCTELDEDLWDEDGFHPWDGLTYGYELETRCTWPQTLETPAEYETFGRLYITNTSTGKVTQRLAGDFQ